MLNLALCLSHSILLISILLLPIEPQGDGPQVETSVWCEELPCLDISGIYPLMWPTYYSSWIYDDQKRICMVGFDLISTIRLTYQSQSYLLEVFYCRWPSCIFIMVPAGLWDTQVHVADMCICYSADLSILNDIPMFLLLSLVRWISESIQE